ncbi:DUF1659 domain-containing protein [Pallidibacillus pasinlerensis]|uniref:DUF1659 domain-containing protein n=1 Tax=Pallidibacillus pasinlerensis TaxID=2703818 RepID=A0ABX0A4R9_9BACI|nr:DUF1659 domain-containing protein [Pallidibacillus pasinlerensis]NCU18436.1 DUF1659 domain-containing protein [Pallidibacillus pasinlerensis]
MATAIHYDTNIRLIFEAGVDNEGNPIFKRKNYNNVKTTSSTAEIFQAAKAIESLCQLPLVKIERDDKTEIVE